MARSPKCSMSCFVELKGNWMGGQQWRRACGDQVLRPPAGPAPGHPVCVIAKFLYETGMSKGVIIVEQPGGQVRCHYRKQRVGIEELALL